MCVEEVGGGRRRLRRKRRRRLVEASKGEIEKCLKTRFLFPFQMLRPGVGGGSVYTCGIGRISPGYKRRKRQASKRIEWEYR